MTKKNQIASPETITVNQLATLANLTPRRIRQLGEEGRLPKAENGRLPMVESIKQLFQFYQRDSVTLEREKTLKVCAERKLREHELGVADKSLINAGVARATISAALKRYHQLVRNRLERNDIKTICDYHASLNLSDEIKAGLHAFHLDLARKTVDGIEADCAAIGRGEAPAQEILPDKPAEK